MSQASEHDLFVRAVSGDWQSRVQLYKDFIHGNPRVRRLGANYPNLDDFLHDCFTNVLRTSHTFRRSDRLSEHVDSVAAWTALERERVRETGGSRAPTTIRLCVPVEGVEAGDRAKPAPYVPPRSGNEDSLPSRISAIVEEPQFQLLRSMALENATWEQAAAMARKPVNTIGPVVVRVVDRLSRYFGAPPALNDDLEPVFANVCATDAATRHADPLKPKGRMISMQRDPAFYVLTPELRRLGISIPSEVRTVALWNAARASAPPAEALRNHLDKCHYCAELLRSLLRLQQALLSAAGADFRLCPGASTLLQDADEAGEKFHQHLEQCPLCRDERSRALSGEAQSAAVGPVEKAGVKPGMKIAVAVTAAVILVGVSIAGYSHFKTGKQVPNSTAPVAADTVPEPPPIALNPKFGALAEAVSLDDERVLSSVLPRNQLEFIEARNDFRRGDTPKAILITERLANETGDPGAQMLFAACRYSRSPGDGYRAMQKSEGMLPRNSFRCWATLQSALWVGDTATVEREVAHLSADPEYGARARKILARMHAIQ